MDLLPGPDQLLPFSSSNPDIRILRAAVGNVRSSQSAGEGKNDQDGVGTYIGKPNVVFELIPVFGHVLVEVGA